MFALPRSSWQDYNKKLISKGGGIFPRSAKSIKLTPQIKGLTGLKLQSAPSVGNPPDTDVALFISAGDPPPVL